MYSLYCFSGSLFSTYFSDLIVLSWLSELAWSVSVLMLIFEVRLSSLE